MSWVFEYSIMYCKNSKAQKTEEKVKTKDIFQFHSCLKNKNSICKLADSCLKKFSHAARVFSMCKLFTIQGDATEWLFGFISTITGSDIFAMNHS